jgi:LysM repeat protein
VWSTTYDDPNLSEDPGGVAFRVGIDPTGGTDALSSNVVYSTPTVAYDAYRQASVIAKAQGTTITVFIRASIGDPVQYSYVYLDDAVLSTTVAAPVATATRPPATATRIPPTATTVPPTATRVPPTATLAPAVTVVSTSSPVVPAATNTTAPVVASSTSVPPTAAPSNTPSQPTPTQEGGLLPTATPIGLDATATAFAGGGTQPTVPPNPTIGPSSTPVPTKVPEPTATPDLTVLDDFPGRIVHVVRRGDTVFDLSRLYGSSMDAIIVANGLDANGFLSVGQNLIVPVVVVVPTPVPTAVPAQPTAIPNPDVVPPPVGTVLYQVTYGDTLNNLSARFRTTVGAIVQLNGITNPNLIFVGQRLLVPSGGLPGQLPTPVAPPTSYVVQPGDNLYRISLRFGRSIQAIAAANNIVNFNRIFVGQTLIIPQ